MDPKKLRYAKTHEWASLDGDTCTVGLTQFAVDQLTDVIYIDMPDVDDPAIQGERLRRIQLVKVVSRPHSAVNGDHNAGKRKVQDDPSAVSKDPYGKGWLIKIKVEKGTTLDHLMTFDQYQKQIAS